MTSQLAFLYSANRRAVVPIEQVIFTSFNARTKARMDSMNDSAYLRWPRTQFWSESYENLWRSEEGDAPADDSTTPSTQVMPRVEKEKVVYLTADTDEELAELREDEVYIIGGIVDHNRYKVFPIPMHRIPSLTQLYTRVYV